MHRKLFLTLAFVSVVSFPWNLFASPQRPQVNVGYGSLSVSALFNWVTKEAGLFEKYGLDGRLIFFVGGSTATMALVSGDVSFIGASGPGLVNSVLAGADAVYVAGGMTSLDYQLLAHPTVTRVDQLKGGTIAISRFGSATDTIARLALRKAGLIPGKDVAIVQVGGSPDRLNAVLSERVTATVVNPPVSVLAEKKGLSLLANVAQMGVAFQHTGVATTRKFIREHPDVVRAYVKAHVEGISRIWNDKEITLKALSRYMGGGLDRATLEKSRELILTESLLPKRQYPSLEGLKSVLEEVAEINPKAKTAKPEQFVDLTFIKELDQNGFIDSLYQKK